jgi:hypothetical protein
MRGIEIFRDFHFPSPLEKGGMRGIFFFGRRRIKNCEINLL